MTLEKIMKYHNSRAKIIILISTIVVSGIVGVVLSLLYITGLSVKVVCILSIVSFCTAGVLRARVNFDVELSVCEDFIVSKRGQDEIKIRLKDVRSVKYRGVPFVPLFDIIALFDSRGQMIFIDYNYEEYLSIWKRTVELCKNANPEVCIDQKILEKIK